MVVKSALGDLELKIAEKQASIVVQDLPIIKGVEFQLQQLFVNLISNALKFSKPDVPAEINITAARVRGKEIPSELVDGRRPFYKVTVSDNGIGFNPADAKRIFEVFQRLSNTKDVSGTGIGLAIVKRIMENHRGIIHATSDVGQGATFSLYFHS